MCQPEPVHRRAAASTAVRGVLRAPARPARVLAAFPSAVYLQLCGTGPATVLAVVTADGWRPPNAAVLAVGAADRPFAAVRAGDAATVGAGGILLAAPGRPLLVEPVAWWSPPRARPVRDPELLLAAARDLDRALRAAAPEGGDTFTRRCAGRLDAAQAALVAAADRQDVPAAAAAVDRVLGLGAGLTPEGDDLVAGFLATLAWLTPPGHPLATFRSGLAAHVTAVAAGATTALSAALLAHAARGEAPAEVAAVVAAPGSPPALAALLAVGQTSGYRLATGIHAALRVLSAGLAASRSADRSAGRSAGRPCPARAG